MDRKKKVVWGLFVALFLAYLVLVWTQPESFEVSTTEAIEEGRYAAYCLLIGDTETIYKPKAWLPPAREKISSLRPFHMAPSELGHLGNEVGWYFAGPLVSPEPDDLEPVALDAWQGSAVATYAYQVFEEPVEIPGRGKVFITVTLKRVARRATLIADLRDKLLPTSLILRSRFLMNLGKQKDYWAVSDFSSTATLHDYADWVLRERESLARQSKAPVDLSQFEPESIFREVSEGMKFSEEWARRTSSEQIRRLQQTYDDWASFEASLPNP